MGNFEAVQAMHRHYGQEPPTSPEALPPHLVRQRIRMMNEEITEFAQAETLVDQADALVDLVVFALGTADMMGLPWEPLFSEVMRANMEKVAQLTDRGDFDLVKPEGWTPPALYKYLP